MKYPSISLRPGRPRFRILGANLENISASGNTFCCECVTCAPSGDQRLSNVMPLVSPSFHPDASCTRPVPTVATKELLAVGAARKAGAIFHRLTNCSQRFMKQVIPITRETTHLVTVETVKRTSSCRAPIVHLQGYVVWLKMHYCPQQTVLRAWVLPGRQHFIQEGYLVFGTGRTAISSLICVMPN